MSKHWRSCNKHCGSVRKATVSEHEDRYGALRNSQETFKDDLNKLTALPRIISLKECVQVLGLRTVDDNLTTTKYTTFSQEIQTNHLWNGVI